MDPYATRLFRTMAQVAQLGSTATVMVEIQPDVAVAAGRLGLELELGDRARPRGRPGRGEAKP